ncbi:MAG: VWA domain-containing protein [Chloroflexota bacterium]|nr:VWA domain-containing protein [Chloroflexota bacterium]
MKNKNALWLAMGLSLTVLLLTPAIAFQQGPGVSVSVDSVNPKGFPEIAATVAALDANGLSVPDLTKDNFQLLEDSHAVTVLDIKSASNPNASIAVCLAIDISSSMAGQPIQDAKAAATTFIDSLSPKDRACVVAFNDRVDTTTPLVFSPDRELNFTSDKNALKNLINGLVADKPSTPLYDAALKAIKVAATQPPGTRAVILFTDGKDERLSADTTKSEPGSVATSDRPITAARDAHIPVFTIGLGKDIDSRYLQRLAEETGGRYQETPSSDRLAGLFQNIATQLKTQYSIKYSSLLFPDDKDHVLQVGVRTPAGQAATSLTFALPRSILDKPFIRLAYKEGEDRKDLVAGQKLKGAVNIVPQIATPGVVTFASFSVDNTAVYTATVAPWTFTWNTCTLAGGSHTLFVQAQDDRGTLGEKSVPVEIVPGGFIECVILPSNEAKLLIGGLALLAVFAVAFVVLQVRRQPKLCPRGLHVMPAGATECPFCAEEDLLAATRTAASTMAPPLSPAPSPRALTDTEVIQSGVPSPQGVPSTDTISLRRPAASLAFLVMESGDHPGKEFTLPSGDTTIGRAGTNDIVIDDSTVGRQQAKIKTEGLELYLYDLAATNPTLVNGQAVKGRHKLEENDRIKMGSVVFAFKQIKAKS